MKLSKQDVFDKVWEHAVVNRAKAGWNAHDGVCVYRGSRLKGSPTRCWVGILIPDDKYSKRVENVSGGLAIYHLGLEDMFEEDVLEDITFVEDNHYHNSDHSFLRRLQWGHDELCSNQYYAQNPDTRSMMAKRKLIEFAKEQNLKYPGQEEEEIIEEAVSF
jgi:hypothetical protein